MLDKNSIAQLAQLKQDILASKDLADGTVVGTNGRYGFVKLTDGRTAFLNPEKMQHVLPGDLIKVNVVKNDKDQLEAEFEAFIESYLTRFVGRYKIKGNAHFVVPTDKNINRWIFLPPQNRLKCKENDYVLAEIARHPYEDGKAAAKVLHHIGSDGDNYLQHSIVIAKYGLGRFWSKDAMAQAKTCAQAAMPTGLADLTHLPLVTIDSATTKDMDDALYCEPVTADGNYRLWVAIADPASFISPGSFIAKSARYFGQTVYLPGRVLPMLPEGLGTESFSLHAGSERAALVCELVINGDGAIQSYQFQQAKIASRHKLTYTDVAAFLDGEAGALNECNDEIKHSLTTLFALANARVAYRNTHNIVFDDQVDFDWLLNKQGFIESIAKRTRSSAHRVVEEAMVATNMCAGEYLASHKNGIFATQIGFRPERIGEVKALLREEFGEEFDTDSIETSAGFIALIHQLQTSDTHKFLLAPLRRFMHTAELSSEQLPHLGMGAEHYAPITSPIRRYADLCNHWTLHQLLQKGKSQPLPAKLLEQLLQSLDNTRQATRELEQILVCEYLGHHLGSTGTGVVRIVTQQGFGVRFVETGVEGFVQIPKGVSKSFDAKRMTLTVGERTFALDDEVEVKVSSVDHERRRVKLELVGFEFKGGDTSASSSEDEDETNTEVSL